MSTLSISLANRHPTQRLLQRGSNLIEFCIIALPILFLCISTLELIHWNLIRQHTDLALYQALRSGITQHANPDKIQKTFNFSLSILNHKTTPNTTRAWIIRHSPTRQDFNRYHTPDLQAILNTSYRVMDSDYVEEQTQDKNRERLTANILHLELWYAHKPITPGLSGLLKFLGQRNQFNSSISQYIMSQGLLVIHHTHALPMQSHAIEWPNYTQHGVYIGDHTITLTNTSSGKPQCAGWWCQASTSPQTPTLPPNSSINIPNKNHPTTGNKKPPDKSGGSDRISQESDLDQHQDAHQNSPECGVSMCCLN